MPYLRSKKWDTRIASARAIGGIVANAELWDPNAASGDDETGVKKEEEGTEEQQDGVAVKQEGEEKVVKTEEGIKSEEDGSVPPVSYDDGMDDLLSFATLDIKSVIKYGGKLLGSAGKEYDDLSAAGGDPVERLRRQKQSMLQKLGMAGEYMEDDLLKMEDVAAKRESPGAPGGGGGGGSRGARTPTPGATGTVKQEDTASPAPAAASDGTPPPNAAAQARLKAMAKRRAKFNAKKEANKVRVVDLSSSSAARRMEQAGGDGGGSPANGSGDDREFEFTAQGHNDKVVVEHKAPKVSPLVSMQSSCAGKVWPFEGMCELLMVDLFDDAWEVRHGAVMGLREVIRVHGAGAGRIVNKTRHENDSRNSRWLEDLACRLCCIFALDKFGDYVSDQVVAPVRESAGQALGALLLHLPESVIFSTFSVLQKLVLQRKYLELEYPMWETCHGGMLGLRYLVSVRSDIVTRDAKYFDGLIECVMHGLGESDDDVQAMAAATMLPIASDFVKQRPQLISTLLDVVWDCLSDLKDDLSASIGNLMDLLAKLCSFPEVLAFIKERYAEDDLESFSMLVPRLYPFLRHSITNVRKAVLRTLQTFLSIEGDPSSKEWIDGRTLRLVFQNLLVEQNEQVLALSLELWNQLLDEIVATGGKALFAKLFDEHIVSVLALLMTPIGAARHSYKMDSTLFIRSSGAAFSVVSNGAGNDAGNNTAKGKRKRKGGKNENGKDDAPPAIPLSLHVNIDNPMLLGDVTLISYEVFLRTKVAGAQALGRALSLASEDAKTSVIAPQMVHYLGSVFATQRLVGAILLEEYGKADASKDMSVPFNKEMAEKLQALASETNPKMYRDLTPYLKAVRTQCQTLFNVFVDSAKVPQGKLPTVAVVVQGEPDASADAFSLADADKIATETFEKLKRGLSTTYRVAASQALSDAHNGLLQSISECREAKNGRDVGIHAAAAAAYVTMADLPAKLNPIMRSLMDSIKEEENGLLQDRTARSVAQLVQVLMRVGKTGPADKIVKNLCAFLCVDTSEVPDFHHNEAVHDSILSLRKEEAKTDAAEIIAHQKEIKAAQIKRLGGKTALEHIVVNYGERLFAELPKIKDCMFGSLSLLEESAGELPDSVLEPADTRGQAIIDSLAVIRALLPKLDPKLHDEFHGYMALILRSLSSKYAVLRYAAAKCFATVCSVITAHGITALVERVIPMVSNALDLHARQGAIETIYHLTSTMGTDILPYVVFLVVPVLGRMSDSDRDVRLLATTTFASIIKLVPLESGIPDPPGMSQKLLEGRDKEREFISQMMDPTKVTKFDIPVAIKADLRKYQQEGVNWLAFLNKYHLHGVLCDDMGLGKTLQTICIVASDHHLRAEEHAKSGSVESRPLPSLIVCPPTLTGHWFHELKTYAPFLKVLVYVGNPTTRLALAPTFKDYDVVVTSYDIARNDCAAVARQNWNYCVLDEGHIIKNAASKLTKAVKTFSAEHRLILSGTPIQNNVLELWSLFDFLMPGFLGSEKVFNDRFAKPIAASRNSKSSSKEQEAGALALEALHKQVLPFLLRRLKEDVLADLPPKIIQDYYCDLSDLQKQLYETFVKKQRTTVESEVAGGVATAAKEGKQHIFQALQYMRKLCNHPALVLNAQHPQYSAVMQQLQASHQSVHDISHAPKLQALQELLIDCGIGAEPASAQEQATSALSTGVTSQHRALIFCQLKDMLDMVEKDLLRKHMPTVTYMRLDGSVDARKRHDIVQQFNSDPSIDVLLLTTHVGGLGLNLTGADTVIFVEHDWNPMNDLQAMDRAHRIGQKKVVNVYRLITRNTLEEKIMGLQKFKLNIASTVINQQNSGLGSMDTDQILDLFNAPDTAVPDEGVKKTDATGLDETGNVKMPGQPSAALELGELWDEKEYEEEYNLDSFISSLKE